jgi:superfamily II DNA or RNA helicase
VDLNAYRDGQLKAHKVIVERISAGEKYTSIILPTRYGKSDIIRCSAIELFRSKKVATSIVLSPNTLLRDQIREAKRVQEMHMRYHIAGKGLKYGRIMFAKGAPNANGEFLLSSTMQLFDQNVGFFSAWTDSIIAKTGLPPLIFIDEAHTGSEVNSWGNTAKQLASAGARIVLLTATAMRSDGHAIPGFDFELVEAEEVKVYKTSPGSAPELIRVDVYEGLRQRLRLVPDHETTFREAWEEQPSPLCKISRLPFDVDLSLMAEDAEPRPTMLSSLKPTPIRLRLGKIVKDNLVVDRGARMLVTELQSFRKLDPMAAAIVFCSNDDEPTKYANKYAKQIRTAIEKLDPDLSVSIATSSDGNEGTEKIKRFAKGQSDVLIVKQMASLGLDADRMKVCLDLSPIRTAAAYVQRLMRIATPRGMVRHCVYICPDDCIGKALFDSLISDSGGECKADSLNLVESYEKEREPSDDDIFSVNGTQDADFEDSHFNKSKAEQLATVRSCLSVFPELTSFLSHSEVAERVGRSGMELKVLPDLPEHTDSDIAGLRVGITTIVKAIAIRRTGQPYSQELFGEKSKEVYLECYRAANIPQGLRLKEINDIALLQRIKAEAERLANAQS